MFSFLIETIKQQSGGATLVKEDRPHPGVFFFLTRLCPLVHVRTLGREGILAKEGRGDNMSAIG